MSLFRRISNLFFRSRIDQEIDQELTAHIEMRVEENLTAGMSSADARRNALLRFGNRAATKESVTGADAALMLATIWSDLRYASRQLLKNPLFAGTAILVLGLGIGSSVTLFAFVDAALIRPLPYSRPSRLAAVFESNPMGPRFHLSYLDYLDYKKLNTVFSSLDAYKNDTVLLTTPRGLEQIHGSQVSDGFFQTLGVQPILGRNFAAGEDLPSAPRHVLLSYAAWQNRYGGSSNVLGQAVTLDGISNTIIGVLPSSFHFAPSEPAEFWSTLHLSMAEDRGAHGLSGIARLKDGVTMNAAAANMTSIGAQLARQYPNEDNGRGATIAPLGEVILGNMRPILLVLLGGATLLLLIACLNVGSLILVRSESRRREVAVRGALGASHLRLLRQFITEGLLLVLIGTVLGLGSAFLVSQLLLRMIPVQVLEGMPYLRQAGLNVHVIAFACTIAILALLLFSLLPAMRLYGSGKSAWHAGPACGRWASLSRDALAPRRPDPGPGRVGHGDGAPHGSGSARQELLPLAPYRYWLQTRKAGGARSFSGRDELHRGRTACCFAKISSSAPYEFAGSGECGHLLTVAAGLRLRQHRSEYCRPSPEQDAH